MLLDSIRRNLGKQWWTGFRPNLPFALSRTSGKRHRKRFGRVLLLADSSHPTLGNCRGRDFCLGQHGAANIITETSLIFRYAFYASPTRLNTESWVQVSVILDSSGA